MEKEIALALNHVLKQFRGMEFNAETLKYLELQINDMINRNYPEFGLDYHVLPKYIKQRNSIQFLSTRKH